MEKVDAQSTGGARAHGGIDGGRSEGRVSNPIASGVAERSRDPGGA